MPTQAASVAATTRSGVWEVDAPDGYVALAVYGSGGRRLVYLEIGRDVYSPAWVGWLERWVARWSFGTIRVLK